MLVTSNLEFKPFEVVIKIESPEELLDLYAVTGYSNKICQKLKDTLLPSTVIKKKAGLTQEDMPF